ncbi:MAG: ACP S-malonyltransferase, partial [Acutalibacteraceae bacterium]
MGKIAFVFSGQGDQYPGMGKDLAERYPVAAAVYEMCNTLRPGTTRQCFAGSDEELKETENTQPCLFAMELAAAATLMDKGIKPDAVAGFSLGEVVAATVSGLFDNETGFRLVCKRGKLMQQEAGRFDTSMAAVLKLTAEKVKELCSKYTDIYPVNFNCPGQITVSGLSAQMLEFFEDVKAAGGKAIPLKVKGAFHSPFMQNAAELFEREVLKSEIRKREINLYSNMTAKPYTDDVVGLLS